MQRHGGQTRMNRWDPGVRLGPSRIGALVDSCYAAHSPAFTATRVPALRDRVRVEGHEEIFFVIYVDAHRRIADVVCGERVGFLSNVPFSSIRPASIRRSGR